MKPTKFEESNVVFAEDQPEYDPLPAYRAVDGQVTTCWRLTFTERIKLLLTGKLWLSLLTFNQPLQPILLGTKKPLPLKGAPVGFQNEETH
jgi:hypothetical protein